LAEFYYVPFGHEHTTARLVPVRHGFLRRRAGRLVDTAATRGLQP
jgi:hypothetical protein